MGQTYPVFVKYSYMYEADYVFPVAIVNPNLDLIQYDIFLVLQMVYVLITCARIYKCLCHRTFIYSRKKRYMFFYHANALHTCCMVIQAIKLFMDYSLRHAPHLNKCSDSCPRLNP